MNPELVHYAEQATLGALLGHTDAIGQVRTWLRPEDFADWWHGQVWNALVEQHAAHRPTDPVTMAGLMVDRLEPRRGDPVRVADLFAAAPTPAHPETYARMVLDAGLRREVAGNGVLLRAGALQAMLADSSAPLVSVCLMVDAGIESAATRWDAAHGRPHTPSTVTPLHPARRGLELRAGADRLLAARPARDLDTERDHVVALVGALVAHPDGVGEVAAWLRPSQIADPAWRTVLATVTDLATRGDVVDPVTVAWALAPLAEHDATLPSVAELRRVAETGWYDHLARPARLVAADQVLALADRAAEQLASVCADPAQEIATIVDTATLLTGALRHTARGLPGPHHLQAAASAAPRAVERGPVAL